MERGRDLKKDERNKVQRVVNIESAALCLCTAYLRLFVWLELGPLHDEEAGEDVHKDPLHPRGHPVGLRGPEVNV